MKKQLLLPVFVILLISLSPAKVSAQEGFIGEVKLFAGNFAPRNWAFCDGQLLPISQNQALFSIVGTMYGGDGRTTFALPDLRARVPVGVGTGPGLSTVTQGQKQGSETATLTTAQLPSHEHKLDNVAEVDIKTSPGNTNNKTETQKVLTPVTTAGSTTVTTTNTGGSQPVSIKPPSLGLRYIICITGIFPSRN
jgi:microcystin-dependent protein